MVSDSSPFSTVAHLHLDTVSLSPDPKPDVPEHESFVELQARVQSTVDVGVPPLLDDVAQEWEEAARIAHDRCCEDDDALESPRLASTSREPAAAAEPRYDPIPRARRTEDGWLYLGEIVALPAMRNAEIEQEVQACFQELEGAHLCLGQHKSVIY